MTDREYLRKMNSLLSELNRVSAAEPYDRDEHSNIIDTINHVNCQWRAARGARPRFIAIFFLILLFVLALLAIVSFVYYGADAPMGIPQIHSALGTSASFFEFFTSCLLTGRISLIDTFANYLAAGLLSGLVDLAFQPRSAAFYLSLVRNRHWVQSLGLWFVWGSVN